MLQLTLGDRVTHLNDAVVYGDFNSPQHQELLQTTRAMLRGSSAMQNSGRMRMIAPTYLQTLNSYLSRFIVSDAKDGTNLVFAEGSHNGDYFRYDESTCIPLSGRKISDIRSVTFAAFDVDNGASEAAAHEKMLNSGLAGVMYNTFSHGKSVSEIKVNLSDQPERVVDFVLHEAKLASLKADKVVSISEPDEFGQAVAVVKHEPLDKFRLVIALQEPYPLCPDDPLAHQTACDLWRSTCERLGNDVLELEIDDSGCDPNRLFYTPRKPRDAKNSSIQIYAGKPLDSADFPTPTPPVRQNARGRRGSRVSHRLMTPRPILSDGFDLIDWRRDWGTEFQITELLDDLMWEVGRGDLAKGEARVLCPNDAAHSSLDDGTACWIRNGNCDSNFAFYCHHNSCQDLGALELLVAIEAEASIPDEFDELSEMLCEPTYYLRPRGKNQSSAPFRKNYLRWDPRGLSAIGKAKKTGCEQ